VGLVAGPLVSDARQATGHDVRRQLAAEILGAADYSLPASRKTREGPNHPDRDAVDDLDRGRALNVGDRMTTLSGSNPRPNP